VTRSPIALAAAAPLLVIAALASPAGAALKTAHLPEPAKPAMHPSSGSHRPHGRRGACAASRRRRAARQSDCRSTSSAHAKAHRRAAPASSFDSRSAANRAAALQAATIAQVLATPCQNTGLTPTAANVALVRAAVLCLVNVVRARHGEDPLQSNRPLEAAAESHGREMVAANYFDHVSPSGVTPVDRVREAGYIPDSEVGYVVGENLAWGTLSLSTPEAIVNAWVASPEHLANILEARYRDTGIDVEPTVPSSLADGVEGGLYTQEFGTIIR
jgi:uncharacterized protein YkwD